MAKIRNFDFYNPRVALALLPVTLGCFAMGVLALVLSAYQEVLFLHNSAYGFFRAYGFFVEFFFLLMPPFSYMAYIYHSLQIGKVNRLTGWVHRRVDKAIAIDAD
ncbi:MAG: hypothetical protein AAF922_00705 [Pseudomonadota bacterium]